MIGVFWRMWPAWCEAFDVPGLLVAIPEPRRNHSPCYCRTSAYPFAVMIRSGPDPHHAEALMRSIFTPENSALLLIDHQVGTMQLIRNIEMKRAKRVALALAKASAHPGSSHHPDLRPGCPSRRLWGRADLQGFANCPIHRATARGTRHPRLIRPN